jgi:hypothetical protein
LETKEYTSPLKILFLRFVLNNLHLLIGELGI